MLTPETIVDNSYRIVRILGYGGGGFVYEAEDLKHKRTVALKQLRNTDAYSVRAFTREAKRLSDLHHPAFPEVYNRFECEFGVFLPMEFIPGENLREALRLRGRPFALEQVVRWAFILLNALDYLHTRDPLQPIIHRDIKPENLKLNKGDRIKHTEIILLDFGLSKGIAAGISQASADESIVGYTRYYASPEQELAHPNAAALVAAFPHQAARYKTHHTDARSDLYSLMATLHTLLTNDFPPAASKRAEEIWSHRPDPLRPLREINAEVPAPLSAIISRAMSFDPDARFASAAQVADALTAIGFNQDGTTHSHLKPATSGASESKPEDAPTILFAPFEPGTLGFCDAAVRSVAFSPRGEHLASGSNDGCVRLWNVSTRQAHVLGCCEHGRSGLAYVSSVSFAPDGDSVASVSNDGVIRVWRIASGENQSVRELAVCTHVPRSIAFSPRAESPVIVTGSSDGAVQMWDVRTGAPTLLGYCDGVVWSVAFSPDGKLVAAESDDGTVRVWHLEGRRLTTMQSFDRDIRSVAFSPDGRFVAACGADGRVRVAEAGANSMRELAALGDAARALAFSPDSSKIVLGSEDGHVRLCDVQTGALRTLGKCDDVVSCVAFNWNNRMVASGSWDKSIRLWDASEANPKAPAAKPV